MNSIQLDQKYTIEQQEAPKVKLSHKAYKEQHDKEGYNLTKESQRVVYSLEKP
jgi:hypothetical protein